MRSNALPKLDDKPHPWPIRHLITFWLLIGVTMAVGWIVNLRDRERYKGLCALKEPDHSWAS